MTEWKEYKKRRPLRAEIKRGYEDAHEAMGVGYLILKARAAAGLTQAQLAKKIRTSQAMVARWESGAQVPSVRTLLKIAQATGYELAVGLREPKNTRDRFLALEVIEHRGHKAKGRILREAAVGWGPERTRSPRIRVDPPAGPPKLTPEATSVLLDILRDAWEMRPTE